MLTKSDLLSVLQCPRKLWLQKNRPDLVPDENTSQDRRARDGQYVNERARQELGAKRIWPEGGNDKTAAMMAAFAQIAANPTLPVVEMPLIFKDIYARVDALIPAPDGKYVLQETKSSTFPLKRDKTTPDDPDEDHLNDAAVQVWIGENLGLEFERVELNLLDNRWKYPGGENYKGLFRPYDVTALMPERVAAVPVWITLAQTVLAEKSMPNAITGSKCSNPHDCPFKSFCKEQEPDPDPHPIELLPDSAGKGLARKLKAAKGYVSITQPAPEEFIGAGAALYRRMQKAHVWEEPILEDGTQEFMDSLAYPRYWFDFEGIDLPVPRWEGVRPYEQIPFQWSCHVERAPGVFEHYAFLDTTGDDPSLACIKRMEEVIDRFDAGPILVYYQTYEKGRLEGFAQRHPEYLELMETYISRLVDLHPLVKQNYYHPKMEGSFSIKKVLPTIAPDLDYKELDAVQEGTGAQIAYLDICFEGSLSTELRRRLRDGLLAYCDQDTWAMVEVGYFLARKPRPLGLRPPSDPSVILPSGI